MESEAIEVHEVIERIDEWKGKTVESTRVMGGYTNINYRVVAGERAFFVKIPGRGAGQHVDRINCHEANRIAAETGIGPKLFRFYPQDGVEIFEWLEGFLPLDYRAVYESDKFFRIIDTVRIFHQFSKRTLPFKSSIFEQTRRMFSLVDSMPSVSPSEFSRMQWLAEQIEDAVTAAGIDFVPCHNDVYTNNFVWNDTTGEIKLLDFEYASMNDRYYDLASLSGTNYFTEAMDKEMLAYYDGTYHEKNYARFKLYKIISEIKWSLWSSLQSKESKSADFDYINWLGTKITRLRTMWSDPRVEYWLDQLHGISLFSK